MKIGDKVYSFINEHLGKYPVETMVIEAEITELDESSKKLKIKFHDDFEQAQVIEDHTKSDGTDYDITLECGYMEFPDFIYITSPIYNNIDCVWSLSETDLYNRMRYAVYNRKKELENLFGILNEKNV